MFFNNLSFYLLWNTVLIFSIILRILIKINDFSVLIRNEDVGDSFDYIIVGGGSAGAVLAGRLSENPNVSVLLLEAGGEGFDILNIPALGPLKLESDIDWKHSTVPQNLSCFGLVNNSSKWPSGKILGGSTHLNAMIYLRGHERDYLSWKDSHSSHWNYEDIKYYFNKAEKCVPSNWGGTELCKRHKKGSILVRKPAYLTELSSIILNAITELGYPVSDLNRGNNTGFMTPQLNLNEFGKRWTSDQFLKKVKKGRKNLKILTNVAVEKILLRNGFEAYGVESERFGKKQNFFANSEIIVSAGAVGSPKLLMLSGIGPKDVLDKANIRTKIDLPVGKNLQDHLTTGMDLIILNQTLFSLTDLMYPTSAYQYFVHGTGPFTSGLVESVGVLHSDLVDSFRETPDLEFMVLLAGISSDKGSVFRYMMGITEKVWDDYYKSLINESVISILPVLLHPKSVGEITLDPNNPKGKPLINPKYLSYEDDVKTLVKGIQIVQKITETKAMKNFGAKFNDKKFPGCELFPFDSDDYWRCYVKHLTLTVYHPVGTCKMGNIRQNGVLDHKLRVHGANKLRVIDASVMPNLPSANTNAAVVMIAEKGADLVKEDYFYRFSTCHWRHIFFNINVCS